MATQVNRNLEALSLGLAGFSHLDDGNGSTPGKWFAIQTLAETTFTTLTTTDGDDLDGAVIPSGITFYGPFTTIEIGAGAVLAYNVGTP